MITLSRIQAVEPSLGSSSGKNTKNGLPLVLVIEDDHHSAIALSMLLDDWGYSCISVRSAREAIEKLGVRIVKIHAIVTDFYLDGEYRGIRDTTALISSIGHPVPVIVTTVYGALAIKASRFPVLRKPFDPEILRTWLSVKNLS